MTSPSIPSTSASHINKWLPLSFDLMNDSFADDLIRQFDKKRSCLHKDLEQQHQSRKSPSASSDQSTPITPAPPPSSSSSIIAAPASTPSPPPRSITRNPRRSSAGELLRRSSAYFRTRLDSTWKNISRSQENLGNNNNDDPTPVPFLPETIAIHTTITFPPLPKKSPSSPLFLSPPVISHYPPKPLHYSPIPIETSSIPHKTLIHRLSMPTLRQQNNRSIFIKRKKSSQQL